MGSSGGGGGSAVTAITEDPRPQTFDGYLYMFATGVTTGVFEIGIDATVGGSGTSQVVDFVPSDFASAAAVQAAIDAVIGADLLTITDANGTYDGNFQIYSAGAWATAVVALNVYSMTLDGDAALDSNVGLGVMNPGGPGLDAATDVGKFFLYDDAVWVSDGSTFGRIAASRDGGVILRSGLDDFPGSELSLINEFKNATLSARAANPSSARSGFSVWANSENAYAQFEITNADGSGAYLQVLAGQADPTAGAGLGATVGALYVRDPAGDGTVGEVWAKTTDSDTGWSKLTP